MNSPTTIAKAGPESGDSRSRARIGFCEGIIEACWLAALILVPCQCNPFAESEFQPAKILVFRVLAILLAAAWLCKFVVSPLGPSGWIGKFTPLCRRWPLVWALAAMAVVYIVANCFSINPGDSFWGRYNFRQGTFTFMCGLLFVAAVGAHLRRREQIERLVSTLSVTGFILSLYAIFERTGHGALPVQELEKTRVLSFLGHPVYFADYLVLIMPITAWRFWRLTGMTRSSESNQSFHWAGPAVYAIILLTQFLAFFFTGSRGGLLGLVAGMTFVALTISAFGQRRSMLPGGLGTIVMILALLTVLNLPNGPLKRLTSLHDLERYSQLFSQKEGSAQFHLQSWNSAARILSWKTPLKFPGDGTDQWHLLRPLIGYGPETMGSVLSREYADPDPNPPLNDRVHNSFWDTWLSLGILGVAAQTALVSLVFYQAYRRLGLMFSARQKHLFIGGLTGLSLGGGLLAAGVFHNAGLAGVGVEFGLAAGFVLFPLTAFLLKGDAASQAKISLQKHSLLVAALAALLSHLVDNTFAFETSATLALVAIYLGMILALDREENEADSKPPVPIHGPYGSNSPASPGASGRMLYAYPAIGTGLILASLLFTFITNYGYSHDGAWETIVNKLTPFGGTHPAESLYIFLFLLVSWLFAAFTFGWERGLSIGSPNWVKGCLNVLIISGALAMAYALFQGQILAWIGPLPDNYATLEDVHRQGIGYLRICFGFIGFCLLSVIVAGLACRITKPLADQRANRLAPVIVSFAATAAIWFISMPFLEAEVLCHWADVLMQAGKAKLAVGLYGQVVDLDPAPFIYREYYSQNLRNLAEVNPDPQQYDDLMSKAETALLRRPRPGMDATDLDLGGLYLEWGAHQDSTDQQVKLGQKAKSAFQNARLLEPFNQLAWRESAIANHLLLHDDEASRSDLERARTITKLNNNKEALGDYYSAKAASIASPGLRQQYGACALEYFDLGLAETPSLETATNLDRDTLQWLRNTLLELHLKRGYANLALGQENAAIQDYSNAAQFAEQPDSWKAEFWLARIYAHEGKEDLLDQHLQRALLTAPPDQKQSLVAWRQHLGNQ